MKKIITVLLLLIASPTFAQDRLVKPIVINQFARGTGIVTIRLTSERIFTTTTKSKFYQGVVKIRGNEFPASASKINGTFRITFPGKITGSRGSRQRMYTINLKTSNTKVSSIPLSALHNKSCGAENVITHHHSAIQNVVTHETHTKIVRVATISTYADVEFQTRYGSTSNDQILSIINDAEVLYKSQLNIKFNVVSQTLLSSPTTETAPGELLGTFRQNTANDPANLKHLFTGKDMDGSTVGIAFVSAICYAPTYAHGVTQTFGYYTTNIFAHEIGHNFSASHDVFSYGSIMYPSITYGNSYFSSTSINQINSHLSYFGDCLGKMVDGPDINTAKFSFRKLKTSLVVNFADSQGTPLANEIVLVRFLGKTKKFKTNASGKILVALKKGRYRVLVRSLSHQNIFGTTLVTVK